MDLAEDGSPLVPIAALEHHLYCPRQCALIHVDGLWADNEHTVRGTVGHRRADSGVERMERGQRALRSVPLWSESLGLLGRADVVLIDQVGRATPVEYKIGRLHGLSAHVQLCAQALCLEEMLNQSIERAFLWLSEPRRRLAIALDKELRAITVEAITSVRRSFTADRLPRAVNDARCASCQLLDQCQPELCARPDRIQRYFRDFLGCDFTAPST